MPDVNVLADMVFAPVAYTGNGAAQAAYPLTLTGSPFTVKASSAQAVMVSGGSISAIGYSRGSVSLALGIIGGGQLIEMSPGDSVVVTYLTAPTITVIPR